MEGEGRSWEKACPHTPAWSTWGKQAALGSPRIPEDPASPATGPPAEKPGLSRAPVSCRPRPTFHLPLPKFSSTGPAGKQTAHQLVPQLPIRALELPSGALQPVSASDFGGWDRRSTALEHVPRQPRGRSALPTVTSRGAAQHP